jgi:hypothetical protein
VGEIAEFKRGSNEIAEGDDQTEIAEIAGSLFKSENAAMSAICVNPFRALSCLYFLFFASCR